MSSEEQKSIPEKQKDCDWPQLPFNIDEYLKRKEMQGLCNEKGEITVTTPEDQLLYEYIRNTALQMAKGNIKPKNKNK